MIKYLLTLFLSISILCPSTTYGWGIMMLAGGNGTSTASPAAGNDFSGDANCTALWRFESGALTTDSKGSNTLTDHNTVGTNTIDYQEGSASADFESGNSEYFSISDADLDAGFPLKNGDANKTISVCGWFRLETLPSLTAQRALYAKYDTIGNLRSFYVFLSDGDDKLHFYVGYNSGADLDDYNHASVLSINTWYHYGVTWQDSDKSYRIRIWDDTASAILGVDATGTGSNNISVLSGDVTIGARGNIDRYFDGEQDELVVFDDIKSAAEIDKIRAGTYP